MRVAIITIAGVSSRFNEGVPECGKVLKCLYTESGKENTLLYRLMRKCAYADRIILVGGYQYDVLCSFYQNKLSEEFPDTDTVENEQYDHLGSGYSLYLGINAAMKYDPDEILFVEGDLDMDDESFKAIVDSGHSVITYTTEAIYANKAVVLYRNGDGKYQYAFNSSHGLLQINEPFSCILNSGQTWKFQNMAALKSANDAFFREERGGTNLGIIQRYIDAERDLDLIPIKRWTNCNTREDYRRILDYWREDA